MQAKRRTIRLPNFEACSLILIAFAAMLNAPAARSQTPAPAPSVSFGPGPMKSAPAKTTQTQAVTPAQPAPKSAASSPKR